MSRVFHKSHRGLSFFFFLIDLQGIEHASRKGDMRILISYMGGLYTLSNETQGLLVFPIPCLTWGGFPAILLFSHFAKSLFASQLRTQGRDGHPKA